MSYSNSSGGTLTLPSPTHSHIDVAAAVQSLRRSMSRSPSKFALARAGSESSDSSNPPHSPSPLSPCRRANGNNHPAATPASATTPGFYAGQQQMTSTTPHTVPFKSSLRLSLRSGKPKAASARPLSRTRASPKSPLKRALTAATSNTENLNPPLSRPTFEGFGQENNSVFSRIPTAPSPTPRRDPDKTSRHSMHLDVTGASSNYSLSKLWEMNNEPTPTGALKRSDAIMNLEQVNVGSPVAKRRSVHGFSSLTSETNAADQGMPARQGFEIHEDQGNREYQLSGTFAFNDPEPVASPSPQTVAPRRQASLRKTALNSYGSKSMGRHQGAKQAANMLNNPSTPHVTTRSRHSLNGVFDIQRESPFVQGGLPNASMHILDRERPAHPLSRTLTTSSSGSSLGDDSPTHFPIHMEKPKSRLAFSKSLPVGAQPPKPEPSESVATPNYKSAKPLPEAFASTGLISKINRNPEQAPAHRGGGNGPIMPDTPCKRQVYNTFPPPPGSATGKQMRQSFGSRSPSTPFSPFVAPSRPTLGGENKVPNIFMRSTKHARKGSFLIDESLDNTAAPEGDLPPTPTKQSGSQTPSHGTPSIFRFMGPPTSTVGHAPKQATTTVNSSPLEFLDIDRRSPRTPRHECNISPLDSSRLSLATGRGSGERRQSFPPTTPTAESDPTFGMLQRRPSMTPARGSSRVDIDESLLERFDSVQSAGKGEFSQVYRAVSKSPSKHVYAVKKVKLPTALRQRDVVYGEVQALSSLQNAKHIVRYYDHWEVRNNLYIRTEFCEEGSLDKFLAVAGATSRLDDFRIWKILLELSEGLKEIHDAGFLHLDLKPANIFISFEGQLKIGDFGMATPWPAGRGLDREGDREYIGREILSGDYSKASDVFSLGLIILEIATNSYLPENGETWSALRDGDLSVVHSLTSVESTFTLRDATGMPLESDSGSSSYSRSTSSPAFSTRSHSAHNAANLFGSPRRPAFLREPPTFMTEKTHPYSLDSMVRWMISEDPSMRPSDQQILDFWPVSWVAARHQAAATVYEGNWGPDVPDVPSFSVDTEMTGI